MILVVAAVVVAVVVGGGSVGWCCRSFVAAVVLLQVTVTCYNVEQSVHFASFHDDDVCHASWYGFRCC